MSEHVEIVTPAAVEPVTLAQAREYLRFDAPTEDDGIQRLITAARRVCETILRQTIPIQTFDWFLDGFPASPGYYNRAIRAAGPTFGPGWLPGSSSQAAALNVPGPPLISVESITYSDLGGMAHVMDPTTYQVSTGWGRRIAPAPYAIWPVTLPALDAVVVRYTAGRVDPDPVVVQAMLRIVAENFEERKITAPGAAVRIPDGIDLLLAAADRGNYS